MVSSKPSSLSRLFNCWYFFFRIQVKYKQVVFIWLVSGLIIRNGKFKLTAGIRVAHKNTIVAGVILKTPQHQ